MTLFFDIKIFFLQILNKIVWFPKLNNSGIFFPTKAYSEKKRLILNIVEGFPNDSILSRWVMVVSVWIIDEKLHSVLLSAQRQFYFVTIQRMAFGMMAKKCLILFYFLPNPYEAITTLYIRTRNISSGHFSLSIKRLCPYVCCESVQC